MYIPTRMMRAPEDEGAGSSGAPAPSAPAGDAGPSKAELEATARAERAETKAQQLKLDIDKRMSAAAASAEKKAAKVEASTLADANKRIADLEAREAEAIKRAAVLEEERIDLAMGGLSDEAKERANKYRSEMKTDTFLALVEDIYKSDAKAPTVPQAQVMGMPPPHAAARGPQARIRGQGIELHTETQALCKGAMKCNTLYAERLLEPAHTSNQYKWAMPMDKMIDFIDARSRAPKKLTRDEARKLLDGLE